MKHALPSVNPTTERPQGTATCAGCGAKAKRMGILGLPDGWIGWDSLLSNKRWYVECCSMHCKDTARMKSIKEAQNASSDS